MFKRMFRGRKWHGKELLNKIQLYSFLVLYMVFPFLLTLLRDPASVFIFVAVVVGVAFYVVIMAYFSERLLRIKSEKFAGRQIMAGTMNASGGRDEEFEFIVYDMFAYETLPKYMKDAIERSELEIVKLT